MIARREKKELLFSFSGLERKVFERALSTLLDTYRVHPHQVDEKTAAVWYSPQGCRTAKMSEEETLDWLKQLHGVRVRRIEVLEQCLKQFDKRRQPPHLLRISREHAEALMTALNDQRLLIAAHLNIGEREMSMRSFASLSALPPSQQVALCEIEFLAYVIDELLQFLEESL